MKILGFFTLSASVIIAVRMASFLVLKKRNHSLFQNILFVMVVCATVLLFANFYKDLTVVCSVSTEAYYLYGLMYAVCVFAGYLAEKPVLDFSYLTMDCGKDKYVYQGIAGVSVCCFGGFLLIPCDTAVVFLVKTVVSTVLYFSILYVLVLFNRYRREKSSFDEEQSRKQETNTYMSVIRSQRHDYNLHVQTVASLIQQEKWEETRAYVNALVDDTNRMNRILPVKNVAIAALINNYLILCANQGITLETDIRDNLEYVQTSEYETNKIIGNLLQNALDEVSGHINKEYGIHLDIFKKGEFVLIKVSNAVLNAEAFRANQDSVFRQGFTTKQGHDGVGLSSIKAVLDQYNGNLYSWLEGGIVHFVACIPVRFAGEKV